MLEKLEGKLIALLIVFIRVEYLACLDISSFSLTSFPRCPKLAAQEQ